MPDPNSLYVGQELLIPDITVEEETKRVFQTPVKKKSKQEQFVNVETHTVRQEIPFIALQKSTMMTLLYG